MLPSPQNRGFIRLLLRSLVRETNFFKSEAGQNGPCTQPLVQSSEQRIVPQTSCTWEMTSPYGVHVCHGKLERKFDCGEEAMLWIFGTFVRTVRGGVLLDLRLRSWIWALVVRGIHSSCLVGMIDSFMALVETDECMLDYGAHVFISLVDSTIRSPRAQRVRCRSIS